MHLSTRLGDLAARAQQVDETRHRIVAATVGLHGTVGPAHTTVSAIAELAGVTRVTVYPVHAHEAFADHVCEEVEQLFGKDR